MDYTREITFQMKDGAFKDVLEWNESFNYKSFLFDTVCGNGVLSNSIRAVLSEKASKKVLFLRFRLYKVKWGLLEKLSKNVDWINFVRNH